MEPNKINGDNVNNERRGLSHGAPGVRTIRTPHPQTTKGMSDEVRRLTGRHSKRRRRFSFRRLWRRLKAYGRLILVLFFYFIWPSLKKRVKVPLLFGVYGTQREQDHYWSPDRTAKMRTVFPVGVIRFGWRHWGIVAATKITAEELGSSGGKVLELMKAFKEEFPTANNIPLAGRQPAWFAKVSQGKKLPDPFVGGELGTPYLMQRAAFVLAEKADLPPQECTVAILGGAGYIGTMVVQDLSKSFGRVIAIDPRFQSEDTNGNILQTNRISVVAEARIVLVLTADGSQVAPYVQFLRPGTLMADDTHPMIPRSLRDQMERVGVEVQKVVFMDRRFRIAPPMPGYPPKLIPGCLVQGIVQLKCGPQALQDLESFKRGVEEVDIRVVLVPYTDY